MNKRKNPKKNHLAISAFLMPSAYAAPSSTAWTALEVGAESILNG